MALRWKTVAEVMNERAQREQERKAAAHELTAGKRSGARTKRLTEAEQARSRAERLDR